MAEPQYKKVYLFIKRLILTGEYLDGELIPSENELSQQFGITRVTVRHALSQLVNEGYIRKWRGKGSVVTFREKKSLGVLGITGFSDAARSNEQNVSTIVLDPPALRGWPPGFFHGLSAEEQAAGCIYLKRVRLVENTPVMLESTYLPDINLPGFIRKPFVNDSLFDTLGIQHEVEITGVEQNLRAVLADSETALHLQIKEGMPVLHILLKFSTNKPFLNIYSSILCNTEKFTISNTLN
jgi:DNA-binding GntR family transcriptional regulator